MYHNVLLHNGTKNEGFLKLCDSLSCLELIGGHVKQVKYILINAER